MVWGKLNLLHRVFEPFSIYLKESHEDLDSFLKEEYKLLMVRTFAKAVPQETLKLTLGQMNFILNLIKKESGKTLNSSPLFLELRNYTSQIIEIDLLKSTF